MQGEMGALDHFLVCRLKMGSWFSIDYTPITLPYGRDKGWVQKGYGQPFGAGDRTYFSLARNMYGRGGEYSTWRFR